MISICSRSSFVSLSSLRNGVLLLLLLLLLLQLLVNPPLFIHLSLQRSTFTALISSWICHAFMKRVELNNTDVISSATHCTCPVFSSLALPSFLPSFLPPSLCFVRSRDSSVGIATGYGLDDRGFESQQRLRIFLFTTVSRPALGPTQPLIQWVPGVLSLGVKRPVREAAHSPPSGAEVKNA
jgi:hypothetical protein